MFDHHFVGSVVIRRDAYVFWLSSRGQEGEAGGQHCSVCIRVVYTLLEGCALYAGANVRGHRLEYKAPQPIPPPHR